MTKQYNVYDNIYTPEVKNYFTIDEWFSLIKESQYAGIIKEARKFKKGTLMYNSLKATLPAITYNFNFHTHKNNQNISGATGLLYIDVDNKEVKVDINSLDKSKIFAYYKSFGGSGYAILVQVEGLTVDNYDSTYEAICNDLGLVFSYDKNAKKKTQFNVLSFDPDIYINYNSFVYSSTTTPKVCIDPFVIKKEKETYMQGAIHENSEILTTNTNQPIRFDNLNEIVFDGEYTVNMEGWYYVKCWMPYKYKIPTGKRNSCLLSYANNLVWLNPQLTPAGTLAIMNNVNKAMCEEPVDLNQLKSIVKSIFKYKDDKALKPIYSRKPRKVLFSSYSELDGRAKFLLSGQLMNESKRAESQKKITDILESWDFAKDGNITVRAVATVGKIGKTTVQKYWPEFKEYVEALNKEFGSVKTSEHEQPEIKPSEPKKELRRADFNNVEIDRIEDFYIANYDRYRRALNIISVTPKVMMIREIRHLMAAGFQGEKSFEAGDYNLTFNLYPQINMIDFKAIA